MNFIFRSRLCSRLLAFCSQPNTPLAVSRKLFKMWKREAAKKQKLLSLLFAHFAMLLLSALKTTLSSVLLLFPCSLYCRLRMQCHGEFHYGSHSRAEHESKARKIFNVLISPPPPLRTQDYLFQVPVALFSHNLRCSENVSLILLIIMKMEIGRQETSGEKKPVQSESTIFKSSCRSKQKHSKNS